MDTGNRTLSSPCFYLSISNFRAHVSACLNLRISSSPKPASLWSHSPPFTSKPIPCVFLNTVCPLTSHLKSLFYPSLRSPGSFQLGRNTICLTKYPRYPERPRHQCQAVCLSSANTIVASQGSHSASPLINVLSAICQPESRNSGKEGMHLFAKELPVTLRKVPGCIKFQLLHELNVNSYSNTHKSRKCPMPKARRIPLL